MLPQHLHGVVGFSEPTQHCWLPGDGHLSPKRGRPTARRSGAILEEQRRFKRMNSCIPACLSCLGFCLQFERASGYPCAAICSPPPSVSCVGDLGHQSAVEVSRRFAFDLYLLRHDRLAVEWAHILSSRSANAKALHPALDGNIGQCRSPSWSTNTRTKRLS
jgi:hypothetical protein